MTSPVYDKGFSCPSNIAVIGGGRWARVLVEVLCGLVPPGVRLSIHTPHNAVSMLEWVSLRRLEQRIQVSTDLPGFSFGSSHAVIVANAARDHEKAAEWALSRRVPVLVEKPLTSSFGASQRLASLALNGNVYFAAAHVFLFARYIDAFADLVTQGKAIQSLYVHWTDPKSECRYGETKSYDPGLPVFADWMPHILPILTILTSCETPKFERLTFFRGGADLRVELMFGAVPCTVQMARNEERRRRRIDVITLQGPISLDFSSEPGIITSGDKVISGDSEWNTAERPASKMLRAFLQGASGGVRDNRLDIGNGLRVSQIIDQMSPQYNSALLSWLGKKLSTIQDGVDDDLYYALNEIFHLEDPNSLMSVSQRIDLVSQYIQEHSTSTLVAELLNYQPISLIRFILRQERQSSCG